MHKSISRERERYYEINEIIIIIIIIIIKYRVQSKKSSSPGIIYLLQNTKNE